MTGLFQGIGCYEPLQISFNTQCSSQWDSLRHFAYQEEQKFYNGWDRPLFWLAWERALTQSRTTQEEIHSMPHTDCNSLQPWTTRNLAGRGVLIDYACYAKRHGISYEAFSGHPITVADIEAIAKEQNVTFAAGDVLFVRTGFVASYKSGDEDRRKLASKGKWVGVLQARETAAWLWSKQFAALASDSPAFEMVRKCCPKPSPWRSTIYVLTRRRSTS